MGQILFIMGFGLGFYFAVYILDIYYKKCMNEVIDEIHEGYLKALAKVRNLYE